VIAVGPPMGYRDYADHEPAYEDHIPYAYAVSKCCCAAYRVRARLVGTVVVRGVRGCTPILPGGMAVCSEKNAISLLVHL
jgi:hypothetical protein